MGAQKKSDLDNNYLEGVFSALNRVQAVIEFELDGTILTANENFLKALGYQLEDIVGEHHRVFCEPEFASSPEYNALWKKLGDGHFHAGEFKRLRKDGSEIWINASYNPIFDADGQPYKVVKFASDVTAQKLERADSEGKITAIGRAQAVIEFNLDGTIITANENFLGALGYSLDEIKGKHHRIFCEEEYANSEEYKLFWEKLGSGEFDAGEYKRFHKDGTEIWINDSVNHLFE